MESSVKVKAGKTGAVVNISANNPEYGWIELTQVRTSFQPGSNFMQRKTAHCIINGRVSELQAMGLNEGDKLPGRIQTIEKLEPFSDQYPEKDLKKSGKDGVILRHEGEAIYSRNFYDPSGESVDSKLAHTNTEEVKAKQAELAQSADAPEANLED